VRWSEGLGVRRSQAMAPRRELDEGQRKRGKLADRCRRDATIAAGQAVD
jgi:hypothetical protein